MLRLELVNVKLAGFSPLTALLHCKLKGPKHCGYIHLSFTVMAATGKSELMFRLDLFSCCERLYTIQMLINHWKYGIVVVLFACGVCRLPRPVSATVVHTRCMSCCSACELHLQLSAAHSVHSFINNLDYEIRFHALCETVCCLCGCVDPVHTISSFEVDLKRAGAVFIEDRLPECRELNLKPFILHPRRCFCIQVVS